MLRALFKIIATIKEARIVNGIIIRDEACKHSTEEGSQT